MTEPGLFEMTPAVARKVARDDTVHGLSEYVKRRLEALGLMDPDTGATRRARARRCDVCRQPVMRGINRDFGGWSVDCDPTPLSREGELQALLAGRKTYDLTWTGGNGYRLDRREASHIRRTPPGTRGIDVLVEHQHYTNPQLTIPTNIEDFVNRRELPDEPPF